MSACLILFIIWVICNGLKRKSYQALMLYYCSGEKKTLNGFFFNRFVILYLGGGQIGRFSLRQGCNNAGDLNGKQKKTRTAQVYSGYSQPVLS